MRLGVYNLEFPSWCPSLSICGHRFQPRQDYAQRLAQLQHPTTLISDYRRPVNNGTHSETAIVDFEKPERPAVLDWEGPAKALQDILLLLSLFTLRDVVAIPDRAREENGEAFITADPRMHRWGWYLRGSLPQVWLQHAKPFRGAKRFDNGLEVGLNKVYATMRDEAWLKRFKKGYYLFLFAQAVRQHTLEAAFVQSFTIWEHLFSVRFQGEWTDEKIWSHAAHKKVAHLLIEHGLRPGLTTDERGRLKPYLADVRHRLVHSGRFPDEDGARERARFFVELTELLVAKTLGLSGDERDTLGRLEAVLRGETPEYVRLHQPIDADDGEDT